MKAGELRAGDLKGSRCAIPAQVSRGHLDRLLRIVCAAVPDKRRRTI
jgi:hypothetical protein